MQNCCIFYIFFCSFFSNPCFISYLFFHPYFLNTSILYVFFPSFLSRLFFHLSTSRLLIYYYFTGFELRTKLFFWCRFNTGTLEHREMCSFVLVAHILGFSVAMVTTTMKVSATVEQDDIANSSTPHSHCYLNPIYT